MGAGGQSYLLIHDIYMRNKELERLIPAKYSRPFKIVYAADKIEVDERKFEEFNGATHSDDRRGSLFKYLDMPISTADTAPPLAIWGTNQKWPYVVFNGSIEWDDGSVTVKVEKKTAGNKTISTATISLDSKGKMKREYDMKSEMILSKELDEYKVGSKSLQDAYRESKIFETKGRLVLTEQRMKESCEALFDFFETKLQHILEFNMKNEDKYSKPESMTFNVFILPTKEHIEWDPPSEEVEQFVDVFGNRSSERAPDKPTLNSKFLSVDDRSFTIKCRNKKSDLYDDLNLSKLSYMQINLHNEDLFELAGLKWYFGTNREAKNRKRRARGNESEEQEVHPSGITKHGFYAQIRDMAEIEAGDHRIMCLKRETGVSAKVEILLDEYCPILEIRKRLLKDKNGRLRYSLMAFETLIESKGKDKGKDWSLYMEAVRALLHGRKVERHRLVTKLTSTMHKEMRDDNVEYLTKFFDRSSFCLEAIGADGCEDRFKALKDDEHFAHCVGMAAMHFARMRLEKSPERDEIMTRPVYDRANLRHVLSKVVSGLALCLDDPAADPTLTECARAIAYAKDHEISDQDSRANLAYFFHMGAYSVLSNTKDKGMVEDASAG